MGGDLTPPRPVTLPRAVLAETVQLDGSLLLVAIVALLVGLVLATAFVVLGFVWASSAGRGSRAALRGWLVLVAVEVVLSVFSLRAVAQARAGWIHAFFPALLACQVAVYAGARRRPRN